MLCDGQFNEVSDLGDGGGVGKREEEKMFQDVPKADCSTHRITHKQSYIHTHTHTQKASTKKRNISDERCSWRQ